MRSFTVSILLLTCIHAKESSPCGFSQSNWNELCTEMRQKHETPEHIAQLIKADIEKKLQSKGPFLANLLKSELGDVCTTRDVSQACGTNATALYEIEEPSANDDVDDAFSNLSMVGGVAAILGVVVVAGMALSKRRKIDRSKGLGQPFLVVA